MRVVELFHDSEILGSGPRCYRLKFAAIKDGDDCGPLDTLVGEDGRPYTLEELPEEDRQAIFKQVQEAFA